MLSSSNPQREASFRRRHPLFFVFGLLIAAMALSVGAMALFSASGDSDGSGLGWPDSQKLGLITITGEIDSSDRYVSFIRELREDKDVLGVLVRVDSGGGGYGPSQEIYHAVKRLAEVKPVVASFGSVAASGGYYAACPAREIFALPGTVTASIGVRSQLATVLGLTDKIGLTFYNFATGKLKDAGTPFKNLSDEDKAYFSDLLAKLYVIFRGDVMEARHLDQQRIDDLQGKAVTGTEAIELGLVDKIGNQEEALDELKNLTGITKKHPTIIKGPKPKDNRFERFLGEFAGQLGAKFYKGMAGEAKNTDGVLAE